MKKTLLVTALVATVGYGGWRLAHRGGDAQVATDDAKLALDRLWIDHVPRSERDVFQVFAALTEEEFGVFQATSTWKGSFELFTFKPAGEGIKATFPQDGDKQTIKLKAKPCNEAQMDYCMEVEGTNRGVKRYYSRKGWEIDSAASAKDLAARADVLVHAITGELSAE